MATDYHRQAVDYALRAITGTDALAFREVAGRIEAWRAGRSTQNLTALDFGCGAGRSTRFLRDLGFEAVGIDRSVAMLEEARRGDASGRYLEVGEGGTVPLESQSIDLLLSTWVVVELDSRTALNTYLTEVARVLAPDGVAFVVANTAEFYRHRWVSCDVDFPENQGPLVSGQLVKARLLPEGVVVADTFWSDEAYRSSLVAAGLRVRDVAFPLAPREEPGWCDETSIAPWVVYDLDRYPAS